MSWFPRPKKTKRRRYPDINTGDWNVQIEKSDGHGFWSIQFDADPKLFAKIMKLAEKQGSLQRDFYPHRPTEQREFPQL